MWTYHLAETLSGDFLASAEVLAPEFTRRLNVVADGRFTVNTAGWSADETEYLLEEWTMMVVPCWDGVPVASQVIVGWDPAGVDLIEVSTVDARALFDRRFPHSVPGYTGSRTYGIYDLDYASSALVAMERGVKGSTNPRWLMNLHPSFYDNKTRIRRTYLEYEMQTVGDMVSEMQDIEGGPTIELQPLSREGGIVHTPWFGRETPQDFEYVVPAGRDVVAWTWRRDARKLLTGVLLACEGSGESMIVGKGTEPAGVVSRRPYLDARFSMKDVKDQAQADAHARALYDTYKAPILQFDLTVQIGQMLPSTRLGATVRVYPIGGKGVRQRWYECRLLGVRYDGSRRLQLELQEAR